MCSNKSPSSSRRCQWSNWHRHRCCYCHRLSTMSSSSPPWCCHLRTNQPSTHLRLAWIVTWEPTSYLIYVHARLVQNWLPVEVNQDLLLPGRSFRWPGSPWSPCPTDLSDSKDSDRCTRTRFPDRNSSPPPRGTCADTSHVNTDWCHMLTICRFIFRYHPLIWGASAQFSTIHHMFQYWFSGSMLSWGWGV